MGLCASSDLQEKVAYLLATPLFIHFNYDLVADFASIFTIEDFGAVEPLSRSGDVVDRLYVIGRGKVAFVVDEGKGVELSQRDLQETITNDSQAVRGSNFGRFQISQLSGNDSENRVLTTKQAGDFFGNVGILKNEAVRQDHTVVTTEPVTLLWTTKRQLIEWGDAHPKEMEKLQEALGDRIEASLRTMPLFTSVADHNLRVVSSMLRYVTKDAGDILFREGEVSPGGNSLFIVYKGGAKAVSADDDGKERVLNTFEAGQFFGEIGLMVDVPRTATIVCTEKTILLELAKRDFQNFLRLCEDESLQNNITDLMKKRAAESFRKYRLPFFASIPDDKYALLARLCEIETLQEGVDVFCEGEIGSSFYLVLDGECKIVIVKAIKGEGRKEIEIGRVGPGTYFGEQALIKGETRNATVRTVSRCVLVSLDHVNFKRFFDEVPGAMSDFMVHLSKYDIALPVLLNHNLGLKYFTAHLKKEYASENIEFYLLVQKFMRDYGRLADVPEYNDEAEQKFRQNSMMAGSASGLMARAPSASLAGAGSTSAVDISKNKPPIDEVARKLVDEYVRSTAKKQVNLQFKTRDELVRRVDDEQSFDAEMFTPALKEITTLMETDSFPRFKQSVQFQQFLAETERLRGTSTAATTAAPGGSTASGGGGGGGAT